MSRIGRQPIEIPSGVTVEIKGSDISVSGPKGKLSVSVRPEIEVKLKDNQIVASIKANTKDASAYWGLTRALLNNMVEGVTKGYEKKLELVGVGYRAKQNGTGISLTVGFSNPIEFLAPEEISIKVEDPTHITISGIDKQLVGLTASRIRKIKKPEPYKGKGIRYVGEVIRRKAGKAGKASV